MSPKPATPSAFGGGSRPAAAKSRWLPRAPSPAAAARVFAIPYAGCGAGLYRNWPRGRGAVEFLPVELPGRETRLGEAMPGSFQELGAALAEGIAPYLDVPFALFGHCWSALAAYEAAVQLALAGLPAPSRLFVSSQVAPQDGPVGRMLGMAQEEMAEELATTIRALGGQPHPELLAIYVEVLRADVDVSKRYIVPDPPRLSCPITAIGWSQDTEVPADRMAGWTACGNTVFEVFQGHHHRFLDAPPELIGMLGADVGV